MNTDQKKRLIQAHNTSKSKSTHSCALRLLLSLAIAPSLMATSQVAFADFSGPCTETSPGVFACGGDYEGNIDINNGAVNGSVDVTIGPGHINNPKRPSEGSVAHGDGTPAFVSDNRTTETGHMHITQEAGSKLTGYDIGLNATNYGKGELKIITSGKIIADAQGYDDGPTGGVWAYNEGTDLIFEQKAGLIEVINPGTRGYTAIKADNIGTGNTKITTAGTVKGAGGILVLHGYRNNNKETSEDIIITQIQGEISGDAFHGISAYQRGIGKIEITQIDGTISSNKGHGVYVDNTYGGDIKIETAGIVAGGHVDSKSAGIAVLNKTDQANTSVLINQTDGIISGDSYGIYTYNDSSNSNTEISTAGEVISTSGHAINAWNTAEANDLVINQHAGTIKGADYGILASNQGSGKTELKIGGKVQGNYDQNDIYINPSTSGTATINIIDGGYVGVDEQDDILGGGTARKAINAAGNFVSNIDNAGTLIGSVQLGDAGNTMSNSGTWNTAGGTNEFGAGDNTFSNAGTVIMSMQGMSAGNDITTTFNGLSEFINNGIVIAAKAPVANTRSTSAPVITTISGLPKFVNNSSGVITMANGVAGDHTIIDGDYHGNGGTIELDTVLGADDSPTDLLEITGNTSGSSNVIVHNAGGTGALTTADGIQIIKVGGSSGGDFTLAGDYVHNGEQTVVGDDGAYAYKLYKSGLEGGANEEDGNWYLRSKQGKGPGGLEGEDPDPLYQAGAATYEVYPQILLGLNGLPTLQQRVGNRTWSNSDANYSTDTGEQGHGFWSRIEGEHNKFKPAISTTKATYTSDIYRVQMGFDSLLSQSDNSNLVAGVSAHYAHASANIKSIHGNGDIGTDAYGLSGTLTWYGNNGFYVDGQAQASWYKSDLSSRLTGSSLTDGNKGFGYAFSVEAGQRIALKPRWSLTPQAQLVYSKVDFDDFTDPFDAKVSLDKGASLKGRLGVSLDYEFASTDNNHTLVYGIANLEHEFLSGTKVKLANVNLKNRNERLWGNVGLGFSHNWKSGQNTYTIYAEGSVATSMKNFGDSYKLKGEIGFRMQF